jgi:preprotein translocase subunit YajC
MSVVDTRSASVSSGDLAGLLPLVLIFVVFWFLILRPARNKQKAQTALRSSLQTGDAVMLGSGIYGRIEAIDTERGEIRLEIAPGVVVRAHRDAVVSKDQPSQGADSGPATKPGDDANPLS